jgi:hypothetical protein
MDLDRESPGSGSADFNDPPPDLNRYRLEIKLPLESWLVRTVRIALVPILAAWVVAGIVIFVVR